MDRAEGDIIIGKEEENVVIEYDISAHTHSFF
jgi:hypothetical protein